MSFSQSAFRDVAQAHQQVIDWLREVAASKGWSADHLENNLVLEQGVYDDWTGVDGTLRALAETGWGVRLTPDAMTEEIEQARTVGYWLSLAHALDDVEEDKLAAVAFQGGQAAFSELQRERAQQLDTILVGYLGEQWQDFQSASESFTDAVEAFKESAKKAADPKQPEFWLVAVGGALAMVLALVAVFASLRTRIPV